MYQEVKPDDLQRLELTLYYSTCKTIDEVTVFTLFLPPTYCPPYFLEIFYKSFKNAREQSLRGVDVPCVLIK